MPVLRLAKCPLATIQDSSLPNSFFPSKETLLLNAPLEYAASIPTTSFTQARSNIAYRQEPNRTMAHLIPPLSISRGVLSPKVTSKVSLNKSADASKGSTCAICYEPFETCDVQPTPPGAHALFLTRCRHVFGRSCLSTWIQSGQQNSNKCPYCRAELSPKMFTSLGDRLNLTWLEDHRNNEDVAWQGYHDELNRSSSEHSRSSSRGHREHHNWVEDAYGYGDDPGWYDYYWPLYSDALDSTFLPPTISERSTPHHNVVPSLSAGAQTGSTSPAWEADLANGLSASSFEFGFNAFPRAIQHLLSPAMIDANVAYRQRVVDQLLRDHERMIWGTEQVNNSI
ncbi:uncharacterized protein BDR25DRAFT_377350 [Lindgomyces ingoldianus]|uniref:Uncharacterized protein n=1 Tax=Lindgomyces ingoldianus TaxID=673940 RepID=A0ACB6QID1_9PLEO|nr:uncharacterized protein BDR25DRAFT_377350 [Lindgomyces ingoldianus]KAF2466270.1 hypothetical protein BDR25DRAFT_377350 [Lindgomyces ingoldianus]